MTPADQRRAWYLEQAAYCGHVATEALREHRRVPKGSEEMVVEYARIAWHFAQLALPEETEVKV